MRIDEEEEEEEEGKGEPPPPPPRLSSKRPTSRQSRARARAAPPSHGARAPSTVSRFLAGGPISDRAASTYEWMQLNIKLDHDRQIGSRRGGRGEGGRREEDEGGEGRQLGRRRRLFRPRAQQAPAPQLPPAILASPYQAVGGLGGLDVAQTLRDEHCCGVHVGR